MISAILKFLFDMGTEIPTAELFENDDEKTALEALLNMVDHGAINEAENRIFAIVRTGNKASLELVLLFYSY